MDDGEEFVGARVPVRGVEAAGIDETDGGGEAGGGEGGEVVYRGEEDGAAGWGGHSVVDELEGVVCGVGGIGEENGFAGGFGLGQEERVALRGKLFGREGVDGVGVDEALGDWEAGFSHWRSGRGCHEEGEDGKGEHFVLMLG